MSGTSKVSDISEKYTDIYNKHYKPLSDNRFKEIYQGITHFATTVIAKNFDLEKKFDFIVDDIRLKHSVESYFFDLIRYKEFHFSPVEGEGEYSVHLEREDGKSYINFSKQAAYMVKWIIKNKPITITRIHPIHHCPSGDDCPLRTVRRAPLTEKQEEMIVTVNEMFAMVYACGIMGINPEEKENWFKRTVYHLHYRYIDEGGLSELFEAAA